MNWILTRVLRNPAIDGKRFVSGGFVGLIVMLLRYFDVITVDVSEEQIAEVGQQVEGLIHLSTELWLLLQGVYALVMAWFIKDTRALRKPAGEDLVVVDMTDYAASDDSG